MSEASPEPGAGLALLCDPNGTLREVLADELGLGTRLEPGALLRDVVEPASAAAVERLLRTLRRSRRAFGETLGFITADGLLRLRCHGVATGDGLLVLGEAESDDLVAELGFRHRRRIEELAAEAERVVESCDPPAEADPHLFEDLSRLNNELANLQRTLAKKNAELARSNEHKNELLGMAAHDLRDPLGVITNLSVYLRETLGDRLDEKQRRMIAQIESNSRFMVDLIDDLLEMVQVESGRLRLEPRPTELDRLVEDNVDLHRALAERKRLRLEAHVDRDLPPVVVDRAKFEQILNNLLSNAIKYTHPERTITVRLRADRRKRIVRLEVADQGQGIPRHEQDRLFEPFQRTSVRATGGEKSTGLGLAIVKRIVDGHQGRIWVESDVGRGSTFSVELPVEPLEVDDGSAPSVEPGS